MPITNETYDFKSSCNSFMLNDPIGEANRYIHEFRQFFNDGLVPPNCNTRRQYCSRIFLDSFEKYFNIDHACIVRFKKKTSTFDYYFESREKRDVPSCGELMNDKIIIGSIKNSRNKVDFLRCYCECLVKDNCYPNSEDCILSQFCSPGKDNIKHNECFPFQSMEYFSYPGDWYDIIRKYESKKNESLESKKEKSYYKDSLNYLAIRIKSLDDLMEDDDRFFLLLIGTDILFTEDTSKQSKEKENTLVSLVDAWGNMIAYWRRYLSENCERMAKLHDRNEIDRRRRQIFNILCSIPEFLPVNELLSAIRDAMPPCALAKSAREENAYTGEKCIDSFKEIFESCAECHPVNWPFFSRFNESAGKVQNKFLVLLSRLSYWSKVSTYNIGDVRRKDTNYSNEYYLTKSYDNLLNELETLGKNAHYCTRSDSLIDKSLLAFFLAMVFLPHKVGSSILPTLDLKSPGSSDEEIAKGLSKIADLSLYVFADLYPNEQTLRCIMWLVSEYAHKTLGLPKRIDIGAHLLLAARGEPALHSMKNYYRDHFFHALEVCFLGHFILEIKLGATGKCLWELVCEKFPSMAKLNKIEKKQKIIRLWYLTALIHDLGYCIDIQKSVLGLLEFLQNSNDLRQFNDDLKDAIRHLSERIGTSGFTGYKPVDEPGKDHGIIGALHLQSLIENIAKDDKTVLVDEYAPAVKAIALHNSRVHTVSFKDDPLAFLLILCDSIEEWNRPKLDFATAPMEILSKLMKKGARDEDFTGPLDSVKIDAEETIHPSGTKQFFLKEKNKITFILRYTTDIQYNSGVFNLWIDASCNFQRLSFEGLPGDFNIEIEYVTPVYRDESGAPYRQLYRLRDAARETHMGFLDRWFPDNPASDDLITNGAVSYRFEPNLHNDSDEYEHLILHLRELSSNRLITKDIDTFREYLSRWKQYNYDRQFKGDYAVPKYPL